jgi:O-antigen ligase
LTRRKRAWKTGTLILFTIVFIASFNLVQNYFPRAVERVFSVLPTSDSAIVDLKRIDLSKVAWSLFLNHPILGIGFGNFPLYYASYSQEFIGHQSVSHNLFLGTLAEVGLMGIISLISIYIYIVYTGLKALFLIKDDPGIFDPWFPLILFVGLNIINALFHSTVIDRPMFTIFAINMIVLRNQQTKPMAADELERQTSLLPKYKGAN